MVLQMILLQLAIMQRQVLVVEEVVREVVADVAEDATAVDGDGGVPVVEEDGVRELPEGDGEDDEEGGWHDEAEAVHGQVVVHAVEEEVQGYEDAVVGEVAGGCVSRGL